MSKSNQKQDKRHSKNEGFGIVEVIVSLFLLGILGMLIAAGLIQAIIANAKNTFIASVTQHVSEEIATLQSADMKCSDLTTLLTTAPKVITPAIRKDEVVTMSFEKVGTWSCDSTKNSFYPVKISANNKNEVLLSTEFLIGTIKETSG